VCTLILAHHVFDEAPVFLASNRDESLDRPASGPRVWERFGTRFVAPRDEQEGGTWLGINEWGVLAAITNRFGNPRDGSRRSRGRLVLEALGERYAKVAADGISAMDASHFVWSDGTQMHDEDLDGGVHVITERSYLAAANGRADFLEARIDELQRTGELAPAALRALLTIRRVDDIDATCVLVPELRYGTRSSTVVALGSEPRLDFSDGAPCETEYRDYTSVLTDVLR